MRPTWMRARSVLSASFSALDGGCCALLHVDEVDHDQAGKVAQAQLAGNLFGRLEVGLERGLLDRAFASWPGPS
jgi:hypothetical protein